MTSQNALGILEQLLIGVHPFTGEILPDDHVFSEPDVLRALYLAILALRKDAPASPPVRLPAQQSAANQQPFPPQSAEDVKSLPLNRKNGRPNAGRAWSREEDELLRAFCRQELTVDEICRRLDRRPRGVIRRMTLLRLLPDETHPPVPGQENAWMPWYVEDDKELAEMYERRIPVKDIAAFFRRSENAIQQRMVHIGLIEKSGQYFGGVRPWKQSDTAALISMYQDRQSIASIAEHFECTEEAIRARLFYLGLTKTSPKILPERDKP